MLALKPDPSAPPRALPALALVVCDTGNDAVRLVWLDARLGAAAARQFGRVGGGGAEAATAETRGIGGNALADAETPRWCRCPSGGRRLLCSSQTTRVSARSESDGDPDRLGHGLRPPDAAAALGALMRRGAVLSGFGAAALATSNADRAPARRRSCATCARARCSPASGSTRGACGTTRRPIRAATRRRSRHASSPTPE